MNTYRARHARTQVAESPERRLLVRGALASTAAVGLAGLGVVPAVAASHPTLRRGSKGSAVRELQRKLLKAGYKHSGVDGQFGPSTERAVKRLQGDHDLTRDGICGSKTWRVVDRLADGDDDDDDGGGGGGGGSHPLLKKGSKGSAVKRLQTAMRNHGYWHSGNDGNFGFTTEQAVMAVQKMHGLTRDGVCGAKTWAVIDGLGNAKARTTSGSIMEVDIDRQVIFVVRGGRTRWVFNTSTGKSGWRTPRGRYKIFRQVDGMDTGPLGSLWRPKYFNGGIAIHGYTSVPGYPASHGCTRVSNAAMNYLWSSGLLPIGRRVWVY